MSNQKDKQLSDTGKIIGINLIAALAYMGLQTVMEGMIIPFETMNLLYRDDKQEYLEQLKSERS